MKTLRVGVVISLLSCLAALAVGAEKPADLPDSYRGFTIYTTSKPDPKDEGRIVMSMQLVNRGKRPLPTRIVLVPNAKLGFIGGASSADLDPGTTTTWKLDFRPPEDLVKEMISGEVYFGKTLARELFIAVRGPDPTRRRRTREADADGAAKGRVVATYVPRVRVDWWRTHPSSSITPEQRVEPIITLASKGESDYVIVIELPPGAGNVDGGAMSDLARCIGIIGGGAEIGVMGERPAGGKAIILRRNDREKWPHPDAYHLFTTETGDVVIEAGHVDGLRNGIYGLLTDHLDCHWFLPSKLGEEIPRPADKTAAIGQIDQRRGPSFFSCRGACWGHDEWNVRNRAVVNRGRMSFGHSWYGFLYGNEELFKEHPEWWARDRAGRIRKAGSGGNMTNFCTTNPEVLDMVAKQLNDRLRGPDTVVTSIDPNDYSPFCLCETCTALDKFYGVDNPDGGYSTDRMIHFANEMHNRLDEENKKKYLGFLVYAHQIELPTKAKPGEGIAGMICYMDWSYDHTRPMDDPTAPSNQKFLDLLKGWGKLLPQLGFYDYPTDYVHYGPYGQVMKLREDFPLIRELGVTFTMIEGQPILPVSGLNLYICDRLQWDVDEDTDVLMEEFFAKYYGPAREPMRKYWLRTEYYTATLRPGPRAQDRMTDNPDMWNELDGYLKVAEAIVAELPEADKRFRDRVANLRDGFELGRGKSRIRHMLSGLMGGTPTPEDHKIVEDYATWLAAKRKQYGEAGGYLPPFLPQYYFASLDNFILGARKVLERAANPPKLFALEWMVIGPFDSTDRDGFEQVYPPEKEINLKQQYEGKEGVRVSWRMAKARWNGRLDFSDTPWDNLDDSVCYALTYVYSPKARAAELMIGSDDAVKVWVNGKQVWSNFVARGANEDQDKAEAELNKGWNEILAKVENTYGGWALFLRIPDPESELRFSSEPK